MSILLSRLEEEGQLAGVSEVPSQEDWLLSRDMSPPLNPSMTLF